MAGLETDRNLETKWISWWAYLHDNVPFPPGSQEGEGGSSGSRRGLPGGGEGGSGRGLPWKGLASCSFCAVGFFNAMRFDPPPPPPSPCSVGLFPLMAAEQARAAESGPASQGSPGSDGSSLTLPGDSRFSPPVKTEGVLDQGFS